MKNLVFTLITMLCFTITVTAQTKYNKDGTPDMRYKDNKETYGAYYQAPSTPSYNTRSTNNTANYTPNFYPSQREERNTLTTPSFPKQSFSTPTTIPTYPSKKDGTADMRYKENRQLYGNPFGY